ncbi:uncharacterized protein LOC141907891 [Tubulanus polymorphus]|uniref:uncharacterized protein LOC141907891 n=1 Tax=Tubulanus polymorphus TaxID=672921 RepID=UPI003DA33214
MLQVFLLPYMGLPLITLLIGVVILVIQKSFYKRNDGIPADILRRMGKTGRKLGKQELLYVYEIEFENNLLDSNAIFLESKVELTERIVVRSLEFLWKRHPMLRMKINSFVNNRCREDVYFFQEIGETPILDFETENTNDWMQVLYDEFKRKFDIKTGPLWRVKMLPGAKQENGKFQHIFLFTFFHSIIDGTSIIHIYREFIENLEVLLSGSEPIVKSLPTLPSIEEIFADELRPSFTEKLISIFRSANNYCFPQQPSNNQTEISKDFVDAFKVNKPRSSRLYPIEFDENETALIIKKSKNMGIRIHSIATATAAVALRRLMNKHSVKVGQSFNLKTNNPVSLRNVPHKRIKNDSIGCMILLGLNISASIPLNPTESDFWKLASQFQTKLQNAINDGGHLRTKKQMDLCNVLSKEASIAAHQPREDWQRSTDIVISNRGSHEVVPKSSEGKNIKFLKTFYGIGTCYHDYYCLMSMFLCTIDGRLSWTLQYRSQLMAEDVAADYCTMIKSVIAEYCHQS